MNKTLFVMECGLTGETEDVVCCQKHARGMPPVGELLRAYPVDSDIECLFCTAKRMNGSKRSVRS